MGACFYKIQPQHLMCEVVVKTRSK